MKEFSQQETISSHPERSLHCRCCGLPPESDRSMLWCPQQQRVTLAFPQNPLGNREGEAAFKGLWWDLKSCWEVGGGQCDAGCVTQGQRKVIWGFGSHIWMGGGGKGRGGVMFRLSPASVYYSSFDHSRYMSPLEFLRGLEFAQTVSTALISDSIDSFCFSYEQHRY